MSEEHKPDKAWSQTHKLPSPLLGAEAAPKFVNGSIVGTREDTVMVMFLYQVAEDISATVVGAFALPYDVVKPLIESLEKAVSVIDKRKTDSQPKG